MKIPSPRLDGVRTAGFVIARVCAWAFVYGALVLARPIIGDPYASLFRATAEYIFEVVGPSGASIRFVASPGGGRDSRHDIEARFLNRANGVQSAGPVSSWYVGYAPTALVISLILVTPMTWASRGWALVLGVVCTNLYALLRLGLWVAVAGVATQLYHPPAVIYFTLFTAFEHVAKSMSDAYLHPFLIWAAVAFRRESFERTIALCSRPRGTERDPSIERFTVGVRSTTGNRA